MSPRCPLWIAIVAASFAIVSSTRAEGVSRRVLPPGAAPIVQRSFARAAPALLMKEASITQSHVDAIVCDPSARCYKVRLDDPEGGCAGSIAGPFCVRFVGDAPPASDREALIRGFAEEPKDACWLDLTPRDEPAEARDPAEKRGGATDRHPSVWLAWCALTLAPLGAGAALGTIFAKIRRRPSTSKLFGAAIVLATSLLGFAVSMRQLALGTWDLVLAGGLLGAGLIVGAYRLAPKIRDKRALLALGSTTLTLVALEIAVRALAPPAPGVDPAELHRVFLDPHEADVAFTRFELWNPGAAGFDWASTLKDALYPGADARFFVEREGKERKRKVLHLGDSMVFGLGVERREAFPALLEGMEEGTSHVNSGIPGLAPDAELLILRRWLDRGPLDMVVLHLFTGNDIKEMDTAYPFCADGPLLDYETVGLGSRCPAPSLRFAKSRLGWMIAHSPPPLALRAFAGSSMLARRSALGLLALRERAAGERDGDREALAWVHLEAVIRAFRDDLAARRIPLVIDVLPLRDALEAKNPSITEAYATRTRMLALASKLGVRAIDAWPPFEDAVRRERSDAWFSTAMHHDLHFGPKGHALLARFLHERLAEAPVAK